MNKVKPLGLLSRQSGITILKTMAVMTVVVVTVLAIYIGVVYAGSSFSQTTATGLPPCS